MVNIIILFKNALRYCPARWIRLKVGSFERSLLKVPKCEILMSWILMIFYHEVYIGGGLEG
jgi:hypothetical protein